jgi:hypothetical protein
MMIIIQLAASLSTNLNAPKSTIAYSIVIVNMTFHGIILVFHILFVQLTMLKYLKSTSYRRKIKVLKKQLMKTKFLTKLSKLIERSPTIHHTNRG